MASQAKSLIEDRFKKDVDSSQMNAIVGSISNQLAPDNIKSNTGSNHVNSVLTSRGALDGPGTPSAVNDNTAKRIIITPQTNAVNKSLAMAGSQSPATLMNNHEPGNSSSTSLPTSSSPSIILPTIPTTGCVNQLANSTQSETKSLFTGAQLSGSTNIVKTSTSGITNGSPIQTSNNHSGNLVGSQVNSNTSSAINTSHQQVVPSSNVAITSVTSSSNQTLVANKIQPTISKSNQLILTNQDSPQTTGVAGAQTGDPSSLPKNEISGTAINMNHIQAVSNAPNLGAASRTVSTPSQPILTQVVSNPNLLGPGVVLNVNPSRPVTGTTAQNVQRMPVSNRIVCAAPPSVRIAGSQLMAGNPNARGVLGGQTITIPPSLRGGTILIKTETGQFQLVNVGSSLPPASTASSIPPGTATYRLQVPIKGATNSPHPTPGVGPRPPMTVTLPASVAASIGRGGQPLNTPLRIETSTANQQAAATPSQMSPNTAKKKCKNFLSTLIRLASDQPEHVATNVKNLIQGLIDGVIQPEDFTNQLQRELNSSPQPCLVPFLRKSLPYLRHSLMIREMTIEGVRAPPQGTVQLPIQQQAIPQIQIAHHPRQASQTVRFLQPGIQFAQGTVISQPRHGAPLSTTMATTMSLSTPSITTKSLASSKSKSSTSKSRSPASSKEKEKKSTFSSSLRDDDDINDVALMGGVNLIEESQRILATNAEFVGAQIRSCKDENFLFTNPLHNRINEIAKKHGLDEVSADIVSIVSHAAQERLKTLVEKLGIIAEHRLENLKADPRYEVKQDIRAQVKFLEELDRLEKKRHEEQEREMLLRAAKSRSKLEDPEQVKLKQKAKELQRAELEEARQREANETALLAIGTRKKQKFTHNVNSSPVHHSLNNPTTNHMRRLKRVNIRDLQFLMEQEKETVRTPLLYKAYSK